MTDPETLRRLDAAARRRAQTEFARPLVLEAGAGTGKTTALVARIAAWSLGAGWERARAALADPGREAPPIGSRASSDPAPERVAARVLSRIVAITFTEPAAAEMSSRVGEALHQIESGRLPLGLLEETLPASPEERVARARALRGALQHLVASTIHAWCRRLLVSHPLDAGLHAHLEIDADGRLRQEIVREVLEPRLRDAYASADARLLQLAQRGVGPREIEQELLALLEAGLPSRVFTEDPFSGERVAALAGRLTRALQALCEAGAPLAASGTRVSAAALSAAERIAGRVRQQPPPTRDDLRELVEWLPEIAEPALPRLRDWAGDRFGVGDAGALGAGRGALVAAARDLVPLLGHLQEIDVERLELGRAVFGELLAEVENALRARGVAGFHDLIEGASRLLSGNASVAEGVRAQMDQLLVDEFQDTDARQCDLLRAVGLAGPTAGGPGLFVVGDPKQSIYGWRSADLTAYDGFVADVQRAGGAREVLYVNYRSVPRVLDEVARVVAPVMRERAGIQPRFEPLVPSDAHRERAGFGAGGRRPAEYWVPADCDAGTGDPQNTRVADATRREAEALARDLCQLHEEHGLPWRSFGVLFRTRSDWDVYLTALREHGVPFAVEGDRSYYRRREIVDAAAWVRAALDPNDAIALLTVLRSAAVGVPDAALVPLWRGALPSKLSRLEGPDSRALDEIRACAEAVRLPDGIPGLERVAGWEESVVLAAAALAEARRSAREDAADVFVETLRTRTLLEAGEAARFQGAWRAANLDRFFRDLLADLEGGADFHRVLRRLRTAVAEERDAEEGRPVELLGDAVQVMTIHGAKGLDFEHVYVMQLHKGPPPRRAAQVEVRTVGGATEYRVLRAPTPGWDRAERERATVEEAERVRTLYVAMTRAKQRLVLSGLWPDLARGSGERLIDLVARSLGEDRLREWRSAIPAPGNCEGVDECGARWVLPALAPGIAEPPAHAAPRTAVLPDEERVAADSLRLHEARREMAARMARPLGAAASSDPHEDPEGEAARGWSRAEGAGFAAHRSGAAAAVGTALHRALEAFDPSAEPRAELARVGGIAARALAAALPADELEAAAARAAGLLRRVAEGPLLERLRELAPHIVARELPVLVAAGPGDEAVGYVSGALDLVYRDPGSGRLVVADYKTGARRDYSRQGAQYRRALREALRLDYEPGFELWYLEEGVIVPS